MRTILSVALGGSLAVVLASCGGREVEGPDPDAAELYAAGVIDLVLAGDVEGFYEKLDARLAEQTSVDGVAEVFAAVVADFGEFDEVLMKDLKPINAEDLREEPALAKVPDNAEGFAVLAVLGTVDGSPAEGADFRCNLVETGESWSVAGWEFMEPE